MHPSQPNFGRKNIPPIFRIALTLALTVFTYPYVPAQTVQIHSALVFTICAAKEFLIGFIVSFFMQMIQSVIIMAGEQMDMQIGISMSKIYDPQSNISMPLSASLMNAMFMLIFSDKFAFDIDAAFVSSVLPFLTEMCLFRLMFSANWFPPSG